MKTQSALSTVPGAGTFKAKKHRDGPPSEADLPLLLPPIFLTLPVQHPPSISSIFHCTWYSFPDPTLGLACICSKFDQPAPRFSTILHLLRGPGTHEVQQDEDSSMESILWRLPVSRPRLPLAVVEDLSSQAFLLRAPAAPFLQYPRFSLQPEQFRMPLS